MRRCCKERQVGSKGFFRKSAFVSHMTTTRLCSHKAGAPNAAVALSCRHGTYCSMSFSRSASSSPREVRAEISTNHKGPTLNTWSCEGGFAQQIAGVAQVTRTSNHVSLIHIYMYIYIIYCIYYIIIYTNILLIIYIYIYINPRPFSPHALRGRG